MCRLQPEAGLLRDGRGSQLEPAAKASAIASVMQDYNQDMYKSIGQQLLYLLARELFRPAFVQLGSSPDHHELKPEEHAGRLQHGFSTMSQCTY